MFCTKCGAQIPDDAVFCTDCGMATNSSDSGDNTINNLTSDTTSNEAQIESQWKFDETTVKINANTLFFQQSEQEQVIPLTEIFAIRKKNKIRTPYIAYAIIISILLQCDFFALFITSEGLLNIINSLLPFVFLGLLLDSYCICIVIQLKNGLSLEFDVSWFSDERKNANELIEFFNNKSYTKEVK